MSKPYWQDATRVFSPIQDNEFDRPERTVLIGHNKSGDFYLCDTLFNGEEGILPLDADSQRYQPKRTL